jgi:hypothetical protein
MEHVRAGCASPKKHSTRAHMSKHPVPYSTARSPPLDRGGNRASSNSESVQQQRKNGVRTPRMEHLRRRAWARDGRGPLSEHSKETLPRAPINGPCA